MSQQKYYVMTPIGELLEEHLTAEHAAQLILSYDGRRYEIRRGQDDAGWELFAQQQRQQAPLTKVLVGFSLEHNREKAAQEIFEAVVIDSVHWTNSPYALPHDV